MSCLNIKDPKKRDAIASDYLATVKRLQRNLNEKAQDLVRRDDIEPIVRSNERLDNQENDREMEEEEEEKVEEETEEPEDLLHSNIIEIYYQKLSKEKLDKYFGVIIEDDRRYKMGDKYVHIKGSDLVIDHKKYICTRGLWSLIMKNHPKFYSRKDVIRTRDVILRTNAMKHTNSRVTSTMG
jgi:hypothetical protein